LGQLGIAHSQSHRGQATVIRLLQGKPRHDFIYLSAD
jgi:hypothetical protein